MSHLADEIRAEAARVDPTTAGIMLRIASQVARLEAALNELVADAYRASFARETAHQNPRGNPCPPHR